MNNWTKAFNFKYDPQTILHKRADVARLLMNQSANIKSPLIRAISSADLGLLFDLYDGIFLGNWFAENFRGQMKFSVSRRLTRSAGLTKFPKKAALQRPEDIVITIVIGADFLFQYNQVDSGKAVGGIATSNSLEALLLVFEHELCHALEFACFGTSNCSRQRFKTLVGQIFGHTGKFHDLPTSGRIAREKLGLRPGDQISFVVNGQVLRGTLFRIVKRAIVMVRDRRGIFADAQGNRYSKYYVPLQNLTRIGN